MISKNDIDTIAFRTACDIQENFSLGIETVPDVEKVIYNELISMATVKIEECADIVKYIRENNQMDIKSFAFLNSSEIEIRKLSKKLKED